MKKVKLTLKDVAQKLGVSTATISNAFNRPDQLSAAKREEILEACQRIGYHGPNKAAQILRKGQSNIVALVLADSISYTVSDPVASTFIRGVSSVLQEHKKHLLLYAGDSESIQDVVDFVDGFICYGLPRNQKLADELARVTKPVVSVDFDLDTRPSVNINNEEACYELAKQAVAQGDHVAILGLRLIDSPTTCRIYNSPLLDTDSSISHRRLDGYLRAIHEAGLTIENDWIWHIPESDSQFARQAAREVLSSNPRPNTVLCMSDIIALELLQCAMGMGIRVPEELKITGFDGIDEAARTRPYLATVCQSSEQKGRLACEMLLTGNKEHQLLPFEIRLGETVG
ncbi:LacI family DNA-binding transcriptional regulator [Alteromonas sp. CYL-A6]|uniref:LacI family DNA-binding transcriptional regulator n=1 Tax=Alteromonas nitratireducens TaxID=3390813 RepID=UPI0034C22E5B